MDCEQLPEELFTDGAEYERAGLDDLPFSHDCPVPVTDFVHRLPKQPDRCDSCAQSVHRCDQFIRPVPACQGLVAQWWANATADFQVLSRGERLEGRRKTRTIALGQSCFVPCARDCWFDCRQQRRGVITALDYHQRIDSQLDRDFIAPEMKGWPDQELASFVAFGAITTPQMPTWNMTDMFTLSNPCLLHIVAQMRFVPSMFVGTAPITPMLARKHREQYCTAWSEASAADVAAESPPVTLPYPPAHGLSAANFPFH